MKMEVKNNCPLDGFKPCRQLDCAWFMKVTGSNPNTGDAVDEWGCSMAWLPIMMLENSQQQRQTGAAVESFRNEVVRTNTEMQQALVTAALSNSKPKQLLEG